MFRRVFGFSRIAREFVRANDHGALQGDESVRIETQPQQVLRRYRGRPGEHGRAAGDDQRAGQLADRRQRSRLVGRSTRSFFRVFGFSTFYFIYFLLCFCHSRPSQSCRRTVQPKSFDDVFPGASTVRGTPAGVDPRSDYRCHATFSIAIFVAIRLVFLIGVFWNEYSCLTAKFVVFTIELKRTFFWHVL